MIALHLFVLITLLQSALPLSLTTLILLGLFFNSLPLIQRQTLLFNDSYLLYQKRGWYLCDQNKHSLQYDQASIYFDAGLFILVRLSNSSAKKTLIIFNDQITAAEKRFLKLNEKTKCQ
tara:strand:+ start:785 stop:1141 length:357 start_codon:yes stop_codon:yes gene_type:complete